jgi:hypothetical protein
MNTKPKSTNNPGFSINPFSNNYNYPGKKQASSEQQTTNPKKTTRCIKHLAEIDILKLFSNQIISKA